MLPASHATCQPCHRPAMPPATGHWPPSATSQPCHRPTATHAAGHWPPAARHATGQPCHSHRPLATGHRLLARHATGHRPPLPASHATGQSPSPTHPPPFATGRYPERGSGVSLKVAKTLIYTFSHVNGMPQTEPVDLSPVTLVTNRLPGACAALKPTCRRAALGILYFVGRFCC